MPAVSTKQTVPSGVSTTVSTASLVVPGASWVTERSSPTSRLKRVDFPTLGRPTRATLGSLLGAVRARRARRCRRGSRSAVGGPPTRPSTTGSGSRRTTSSRRSPVPRPWRALTGHGSPSPRDMASQASASRWDESTLLATTRTGRPDRLSRRATAMSSSVTPTVTSTTIRTTSASAMARSAWAVTWASRGSTRPASPRCRPR